MSEVLDRFAAALLDPSAPVPIGVQSADARPDRRRFAVYRNNVYVSLVGALESRFPVTRRLVGEAFFRGMARAFAAEHKPRSPMLMQYGDALPEFITAFAPAKPLSYLADVAQLEVAWSAAYHAADAPALTLAELAAYPADRLGRLRFRLHPATRLVVSEHPVGGIWMAHQGEGAPQALARHGAEAVLISRPQLEVRVTVLPPADLVVAQALLQGDSLDTAAASDPGRDAGAILIGLIGIGAFSACIPEEETGR